MRKALQLNNMDLSEGLTIPIPEGWTAGLKDVGEVSDGYHTFDELYEHRHALFLALCASNPSKVTWKSHNIPGWFLLEMKTDSGQISYHLPTEYLPQVEKAFVRDDSTEWDGHTSQDVVKRLLKELDRVKGS